MNIFDSIPSPDINLIQLGPFRIYFYALFILSGIVAAVVLTSRRLSRRGGQPGLVIDIAIWTVPFGIVGGRLYHVVTHPNDYFFPGADLWKTLYVWEGGLAIFGAVIFGSVGAYIACRRAGLRFLSFADALAPGMLLAQALGRLGNYFNQELFGTPTTLPWGLEIDPSQPAFPVGLPVDTLFHPLFLYEILWNLFGVIIILLADRQFNLRWGRALGLYLVIYGTGRTWFESFRLDPTEFELLGVKINMITAAVVAIIGLIVIVVQSLRHREPETSPYLPGRAWSSEKTPVDSL
ncbi:prolipoprotein diacylglyceryl transferase [Cryobacterium glaciale]|uniref:Phosphatidylglycerol--prolipoprotein diacylglyceryl transferase n=1 Tax=Cryobacterium glaciale TaxID=1259145 RepID=A0A4R8V1M7_9MICO|nr:prolipoprotein diacylglyceryl transferase [Cryobacterium glaciale]TFB76136.1 prolipoprotein diacylglyceryl transferase [Cryobacterium glaciale]